MILQLNPPLPMLTSKGKGFAHLVIDYSQEHDLLWVVFLDKTGECWTLPNSDVRMQFNYTMGRRPDGDGVPPADVAALAARNGFAISATNGTNGHSPKPAE